MRLRAQPGFRAAAVAFFLTVVLGVGSTVAYAYWSQSAPIAIAGTTRSELPKGTTPVTANPVLLARPGTPSEPVCAALLTDLQMRPNNYADVRFSWTGSGATRYVVTVRSNDKSYAYDQTQTVNGSLADFRFGRLPSDGYGKPVGNSSPFYTTYTVRVMPMNGDVPGDPLYFTYEYEHYKSNNCYYSEPTGAAPLGDINLVCALPAFKAGEDYTDAKFTWSGSAGATTYSATMTAQNGSGYGGEQSTPAVNASFRVIQPQPVPANAPYLGRYTVRVQPMNGVMAGDPRYLTYQLGPKSHECWAGR